MLDTLARIGRSTLNRYLVALDYPDYRNMWMANLSAQTAAWALIVARGWFVYEEHHMSSEVALTTFAAMIPSLIVPPIAGVYADRLDRRKMLAVTYLVNMLVNLTLAVLAISGLLEVWMVVALSLINGSARYTQMPVSQALAANLVPRSALLNALSLNAATGHFSKLVGAAIVTPLLALLGAPIAFFVCTAFYGIGFFQTLRIRTVSRGGAKEGTSILTNIIEGLRYLRTQPLILMVTILVCFHCGLTMAFESTLPALSHQRLGAGTEGFGILMTAVGIGALVGSIYIGGVSSALIRGRLFLVFGVLSGVGQVVLGFAPDMFWAYIAALIMGSTQAAFMTLGQAITQSLADDAFRGRVASLNTLSFQGLMAMMSLFNGYFADAISANMVLLFDGALFVAIMLLSFSAVTARNVYINGLPAEAHAGAH